MSATSSRPEHMQRARANLREVRRLTEIHGMIAGRGPGHKHNVEVLNKSAVVLLVACWEAYVEDLAVAAFARLLNAADGPSAIPAKVLAVAAKPLRDDPDERKVWSLAGDGWRAVLQAHSERAVAKFVTPLNTPRAEQVDKLFEALVGLSLSQFWHWQGMSVERAKATLDKLISLRGEVAHRVAASVPVRQKYVRDMRRFVARLAAASDLCLFAELEKAVTSRRKGARKPA